MISIAIDGPAGAGKSTLARALAKQFGYIYVDTGALYRAIGIKILDSNIECENSAVESMLDQTSVDLKYIDAEQQIFLDGRNVTGYIRSPEASMMASKCSALPSVRTFLLQKQRMLAEKNSVVMDGRDIGTVVLPKASVKIFLTASAEERARRRFNELSQNNTNIMFADVLEDIKKRDYNDSHRKIAPLKPADDAVTVDTSDLNFEEALNELKRVIEIKLGEKQLHVL